MAHPCEWKGCDAVLGSEDLLMKHIRVRNHAEQGKFGAGVSNRVIDMTVVMADTIQREGENREEEDFMYRLVASFPSLSPIKASL
jgi:hypothetical protein